MSENPAMTLGVIDRPNQRPCLILCPPSLLRQQATEQLLLCLWKLMNSED